MPYKDIQNRREYNREWARRKRKGLITRGIRKRKLLPKEERKRRMLERSKKYRKQVEERVNEVLGKECFFCNSKRCLQCHRKDGKPHKNGGNNGKNIAIKNPKEFVRLCYSCHKGVHWVMKWFNMNWETILKNIKTQK